jgi:hypothetical protein
MKKITTFILSILFVNLFLSSCGGWRDNIKLSTKSAVFSGNGDSIIVTTKGGTWWLSEILVDGNHFFNFDGIDIHSDSYTIKQDCFIIERRDRYTLFIRLEENPLNDKKTVIVVLEAGDYFDRVTITQNPK